MKVLVFTSHLLSYVFQPLFMVFFLVIISHYNYDFLTLKSEYYHFIIFGVFLVFTAIIPAIFLLIMFYMGIISDLNIKNRNERFLPYFFVTAFYLATTFVFWKHLSLEIYLIKLLIMATFVIFITGLINMKFKISAHVLALTCLCGYLLKLSFNYSDWNQLVTLSLIILLTGLVASARLILKSHDGFEVTSGAIVGSVIGYLGAVFIFW